MKKISILFVLLLPLGLFAQNPTARVVPIADSTKRVDTVITKDKLIPGREHLTITYPNGSLLARGFMVNGLKEGVWQEYDADNWILSRVTEYHKGIKNGASVTLSVIGQVAVDETFFNDTVQGKRTTFQSNGRIHTIENYKNGILNGEKKSFYDNTKLQEETHFKNGTRDGITRWYQQNGKISLEYTYVNGDLQGIAKEYDENGDLKKEGNYLNNDEEGEWKVYEKDTLVKKVIYKKGEVIKEVPVKK